MTHARDPACRSIWSTIGEQLEGKQSAYFEEIGVDDDEAAGVDYKQIEALRPLPKKRKL